MNQKNEGSIVFQVRHHHKDWATNSSCYNFRTTKLKLEGISVKTTKHPDKTVEIKLIRLSGKTFTFRNPVPACDERGLHVAITWKEDKVKLYLNGQLVETKSNEED